MKRSILLSFDVEEFDIPLEYNYNITPAEQLVKGKEGLDALGPILGNKNISATLFTTAHFAQQFPVDIKQLAGQHEIASHTFYHSSFEVEHLATSRLALENITGKPVHGLRMPRMRKVEMQDVIDAGYQYDSSINPTWLPGRYNNLHLSRTVYLDHTLPRIPASVSPMLRLPLFWLGFKNYPYAFFRYLCKRSLAKDGYVCLYFHPWEFTPIDTYSLPGYVSKPDGDVLLERLNRLITDLSSYGEFTTIADYLADKNYITL